MTSVAEARAAGAGKTAPMGSRPTGSLIAAVTIASFVFLGFVLRLTQLSSPDLGLDGGATLALAFVPLPDLIAINAADVHPPLFFVVVRGWDAIVGSTPFALRMLPLICGVVTIPLVAALGRRVGGERVGVLGAALVTFWPAHVLSSRTVREGAFALMLSMLALVVLAGIGRRVQNEPAEPQSRQQPAEALIGWGVYVVALAASGWSSYLAVVLMPAHLAIIWLARVPLSSWIRALLAAGGLTIPWAVVAIPPIFAKIAMGTSTRANPSDVATLPDYLRQVSVTLFGSGEPVAKLGDVGAPALVAFGIAVAVALSRATRGPLLVLLGAAISGIALIFGFVRLWANLHAIDRYLVFVVPVLAVALSLAVVRTTLPPALRVALLVPFAWLAVGRMNYYWHPNPHAIDFWDPLRTIDALDRVVAPCDTILFLHIEQAGYYRSIARTRVRSEVVPVEPFYMVPDKYGRTGRVLAIPPLGRLWVLSYLKGLRGASDALAWLDERYFPADRIELNDSLLYAYVPPRPGVEHQVDANFAGLARLRSATINDAAAAGDGLALTLVWDTIGQFTADYTVFVHLLDAGGKRWSQHDGVPAAALRPTSSWKVGETIVDRHGLIVSPEIPPGEYHVLVGLYRSDGRLKTVDGRDSVDVATIRTTLPPAGSHNNPARCDTAEAKVRQTGGQAPSAGD